MAFFTRFWLDVNDDEDANLSAVARIWTVTYNLRPWKNLSALVLKRFLTRALPRLPTHSSDYTPTFLPSWKCLDQLTLFQIAVLQTSIIPYPALQRLSDACWKTNGHFLLAKHAKYLSYPTGLTTVAWWNEAFSLCLFERHLCSVMILMCWWHRWR